MQQLKLFSKLREETQDITMENVKAVFNKISDDTYELLLEVNSNKFLINIKIAMDKIEKMEIVAVKGFVEVSVRILRLVKRIVYKLYFEG